MAFAPAAPGRPHERAFHKRSTLMRSLDGDPKDLGEPSVGLPVIHDEIAVHQATTDPEGRSAALESQHRAGKGAVGDCKRYLARNVVDDFVPDEDALGIGARRSDEHTSELQSLMRISYAV